MQTKTELHRQAAGVRSTPLRIVAMGYSVTMETWIAGAGYGVATKDGQTHTAGDIITELLDQRTELLAACQHVLKVQLMRAKSGRVAGMLPAQSENILRAAIAKATGGPARRPLFASRPVDGPPCVKCGEARTQEIKPPHWHCANCGHDEVADVSGI